MRGAFRTRPLAERAWHTRIHCVAAQPVTFDGSGSSYRRKDPTGNLAASDDADPFFFRLHRLTVNSEWMAMDASNTLVHLGHRLLQIGVALFLFTSFEGLAIPYIAVPLLGRSAHSLSALLGVILIVLGLLWPKLKLGPAAARIAFWFLIYSGFAITAAFIIAALWGAGRSTMPLSGAPEGTAFQELVIASVAYSSAPTGITSFALILWGLRLAKVPPPSRTLAAQRQQ